MDVTTAIANETREITIGNAEYLWMPDAQGISLIEEDLSHAIYDRDTGNHTVNMWDYDTNRPEQFTIVRINDGWAFPMSISTYL